jgi:hypothetical protein
MLMLESSSEIISSGGQTDLLPVPEEFLGSLLQQLGVHFTEIRGLAAACGLWGGRSPHVKSPNRFAAEISALRLGSI